MPKKTGRQSTKTTAGISFSADKAVKLYKANTSVADIAVAMGYERGHGQNRVRAALEKAGVYESKRAGTAITKPGKVIAMAAPTGPEVSAQECYRFVESRYHKLVGRQRTGWIQNLCGLLLAGLGETAAQKIQPVTLPQGLPVLRGKAVTA